MTPSSEHPSTTTIIEESSAESCIDPATFRRNRMDELKDDGRRPSLPVSSIITSGDVHYTPIEVVSAASKIGFNNSAPIAMAEAVTTTTTTATSFAASPPTGSGVHYTTILGSQPCEGAFSPPSLSSASGASAVPTAGSDYMIMTPLSLAQHSGSSSSNSSLKRHQQLEPERKRLSMLGLEEDPFPNLSHTAGITSPSSQSSYNPLEEDEAEPSYLVMSPVGSSGGGTLPKRGTGAATTSAVGIPTPSTSSYHRRTGSSSFRSSSVEVKDDDDGGSQYMTMSPTVTLSKQPAYNGGRNSSSRATPTSSATAFGTSPSAALTSHFPERLPLFDPIKKVTPTTKFESSSEEVGGYLVMSPVNAENFDKTPRTSFLSEKFRASSVDTSGPPIPRSADSLSSANRRDMIKRSSLCSEDAVPRGWSPTHPGPAPSQPDHNPIEDYEDFAPTKASLYHHHHPQHTHHRSSKSNFIPISQTSGRRTSPASSSSIISGTPNSTEGISTKPAPLVRSSSDDDLMDDELAVGESSEFDPEDPVAGSSSSFSAGMRASKTVVSKAGSRASNSSLASRGSSSRYIDIPGGGTNKSVSSNVSAQSSVTSTTNSGIASFLGSIFRGRSDSAFRNRSDSVPSRPASDGRRRHRTQSEGENLEGNNT